jgi:hypothetical protein
VHRGLTHRAAGTTEFTDLNLDPYLGSPMSLDLRLDHLLKSSGSAEIAPFNRPLTAIALKRVETPSKWPTEDLRSGRLGKVQR